MKRSIDPLDLGVTMWTPCSSPKPVKMLDVSMKFFNVWEPVNQKEIKKNLNIQFFKVAEIKDYFIQWRSV